MGFTQEKNIGWYDNDMLMSQNVYDTNNGNCFDELLFDQSWDWLMPVVVKLFDDEYNEFDGVGDLSFRLNDTLLETNLDSLYSIVVEFIKNQNN
jgi:hypothetical protein